jgi:outer membrane lipoprotein carrier protein
MSTRIHTLTSRARLSRRAVFPLIAAVLAVLVALPAPSSAADGDDAWQLLGQVRQSLSKAGAQQSAFEQTYIPAGFSSGESETGRLALSLPDCLRFDYEKPYPKTFLLCGNRVHSWNPEDRRGQRSTIDRTQEPGLDLLLLPTGDLGSRYEAATRSLDGGRTAIDLKPKPGAPADEQVTAATLVVDRSSMRLVEVSYRDGEGNRTRFALGGYRNLGGGDDVFSPPEGIAWEDS